MRRQYLYVYTCRKHFGWRRQFGYTGRTNSPALRDLQHRDKPWYDLVTRRRVIPLGRVPVWVASVAEYVLIKVTMPTYNVQHNRTNPRRIPPHVARLQRAARDGARLSWTRRAMTYRPNPLSVLPVILVAMAALYLWSR